MIILPFFAQLAIAFSHLEEAGVLLCAVDAWEDGANLTNIVPMGFSDTTVCRCCFLMMFVLDGLLQITNKSIDPINLNHVALRLIQL